MAASAAASNSATSSSITPETKPIQVKLVLLGEAAVGKSSVVQRFVSDQFTAEQAPTIGAAFLTQKCTLADRIIKYEIWDTAGQERFHSLAPMYYRNALAALVVFDLTRSSSLEKAKSWVKELQRQGAANIVIALVGNKLDMESERQLERSEAEAYAAENNLIYFETSAKTGEGVKEVFTELAKKLPVDIPGSAAKTRTSERDSAAAQGSRANGRVNINSRADTRATPGCC